MLFEMFYVEPNVGCWMYELVVECWTTCWMLNMRIVVSIWELTVQMNLLVVECFFSFFLAATPCWIFSGDFFPVPGAPDRFLAFFAGRGSLPERRDIFPRSLARTRSAGLFLGCSWAPGGITGIVWSFLVAKYFQKTVNNLKQQLWSF